jgi:hypothetical protein
LKAAAVSSQVHDLVGYARLRGIRLIPELEQTGHASYLWSLAGAPHSLEFCSNNTEDKTGAQVYNDPDGRAEVRGRIRLFCNPI